LKNLNNNSEPVRDERDMSEKEKILEPHNRNKIYAFISKYPGVHLRQIIEKIDLSEGTIKYHLDVLLKENLIDKKEINGYKRFYKQGKNGKFEQKILAAFREKTTRFILLYLLYSVVSTVTEISREVNKDPKTISYHINKLKEMGLVETVAYENGILLAKETRRRIIRDMKNREILYRVNNYVLVYLYVLKYKQYFMDKETKDLLYFLSHLAEEKKDAKYIEIKSTNTYFDNYINAFYEFFPISYCA
jgi:DNA-binding transcriptional ArsR family regulator